MSVDPATLAAALRPLHRQLDGTPECDCDAAGDCSVDPAEDTPYPSSNANHLRGLGIATAPTAAQVQRWIARYRVAGVSRCFAAVHPGPAHEPAIAVLAQHGFTPFRGTTYPVLARDLRYLPTAEPPFPLTVFTQGIPPDIARDLDALYAQAGWRRKMTHLGSHWLVAKDGDAVVAAGLVVIHGPLAWLGMAATRESHRRRGLQRSLIARRLAIAHQAGCQLAVAETLGRLKESLRNLQHAGFREIYSKQVLVRDLTTG